MVKSDELICTTKYLTLQAKCRINQCRYNRVSLHLLFFWDCLRLRPMLLIAQTTGLKQASAAGLHQRILERVYKAGNAVKRYD
jgi:hypothetical protein